MRLGNVSKIIHYGYTASASKIGNCKLLRITDIQNNRVNWDTVPFCNIKEKEVLTYNLNNRDILIARTGGTIGKSFIIKNINEKSVFASYLIRVVLIDEINEDYIKLFLESPFYWLQLTALSMGTGQPNVNGQSLSSLLFPLPPLREQCRIFQHVSHIEPKIERYNRYELEVKAFEFQLPDQLKKSVLQYAIQGKLVPQNPNDELASKLLERIREEKKRLVKEKKIKSNKHESIIFKDVDNKYYEKVENRVTCLEEELPFQIPENWEWTRLGNVSKTIHYGYTASASKTGNCKLLRITDIQNNTVFWDAVPYCTVSDKELLVYGLNKRDILIARTGGTIGKSFIINDMAGNAVFASYLIRVIPVENINEQFIKLFLESPFYWLQLTALSMGTGQPNVNGQSLSSLLIPLPPFEEQERILKKIENLKNKFLVYSW